MPVKALPPAPVVPPSWTGFYIGGEVGGAWSDRADTWLPNDPLSTLISNGTTGNSGTQPLASPYNVKRSGVVGGLEGGYNWQVDRRWVVGLEADFNGSNVRGSGTSTSPLAVTPVLVNNVLSSIQTTDWYGTVRARAGWLATPNLLIFGTGGLAYGGTRESANFAFTSAISAPVIGNFGGFTFRCTLNAACYSGSSASTNVGWAAGGGIEWMFDRHWSAKVEYQFVDLGSARVLATALSPFPGTAAPSFNVIFKDQFNVVRVGVNYKF